MTLNSDGARSVVGLKASELVHRTLLGIIQLLRFGMPALDDDVSLEQRKPDRPIDRLLAGIQATHDKFPLRTEPEAIVQDLAELGSQETVTERADVAVEREAFEVHVSLTKDGGTRSLVASARLYTDEPILDNVDPPNTVFACERIERQKDGNRFRDGRLRRPGDGQRSGDTPGEVDSDAVGRRGGSVDRLGQLPHVRGRRRVRVFKDTCLVRYVEEVLVRRPWLGGRLHDGDPQSDCKTLSNDQLRDQVSEPIITH
jgi:hypothetical protein